MATKDLPQIEIIINALVSSFRFILIPMSWVYDHYDFFNSFNVRITLDLEFMSKDRPHVKMV